MKHVGMTDNTVACSAIRRAARHAARGESVEAVLRVAPDDARRWVRDHPSLFTDILIPSWHDAFAFEALRGALALAKGQTT